MPTRQNLATTTEVAEFLGVPERTLYQWVYKNVGPRSIKVGRHTRYAWPDVERWLEQCRRNTGGDAA